MMVATEQSTLDNIEKSKKAKEALIKKMKAKQKASAKNDKTKSAKKNDDKSIILINKLKAENKKLKTENSKLKKSANATNKSVDLKNEKTKYRKLLEEFNQLKSDKNELEKDKVNLQSENENISNLLFDANNTIESKNKRIKTIAKDREKYKFEVEHKDSKIKNLTIQKRAFLNRIVNLEKYTDRLRDKVIIKDVNKRNDLLRTYKELNENKFILKELNDRANYLLTLLMEQNNLAYQQEQFIKSRMFKGETSFAYLDMYDVNTVIAYLSKQLSTRKSKLSANNLLLLNKVVNDRLNSLVAKEEQPKIEKTFLGTVKFGEEVSEQQNDKTIMVNNLNGRKIIFVKVDDGREYDNVYISKYAKLKDGDVVSVKWFNDRLIIQNVFKVSKYLDRDAKPEKLKKYKNNSVIALPNFVENVTIFKSKTIMLVGGHHYSRALEAMLTKLGAKVVYVTDTKKDLVEIERAIDKGYLVLIDILHSSHAAVALGKDTDKINVKIVRDFPVLATFDLIYNYYVSAYSRQTLRTK